MDAFFDTFKLYIESFLRWIKFWHRPMNGDKRNTETIAFSGAHETTVNSGSDVLGSPIPFFALIIGINQYECLQIPPLRGAVPDAGAVQHVLENNLRVPTAHICNLRDKEATRDAIIGSLQALEEDTRIKHGDAILIYFAGHGCSTTAPTGTKIEALVPYDYKYGDDRQIHSIPAHTIAVLLQRLADLKGDNITVILDCCHSALGTQTSTAPSSVAIRGIDSSEAMSSDVDRKVFDNSLASRALESYSGFTNGRFRSHVVLAACGPGEPAHEEREGGVFTMAFLQTWLAMGGDRITYKELIQHIPQLYGQTPRCEGYNEGRVLFNERAVVRGVRRNLFRVHKTGDVYIMDGGSIHGIAVGAEFAVHEFANVSPTVLPLGHLVVTATTAYSTTLKPTSDSPVFALEKTGFALQSRASAAEDLYVHIGPGKELADVFRKVIQELNVSRVGRRRILPVTREEAEFDVVMEHGRIVFDILDNAVTQYGLTRLPFDIAPQADHICRVLGAAAHYFWHLRRTTQSNILRPKISIEFTRLMQLDECDDFLMPILVPDTPNLVQDGVVDLCVDETSMYGIKITNDTNVALFPSLFYFDNSDLSIQSSYLPPTSGGKINPPLPPGSSLTIGYGSGSVAPFTYFLRDGQNVDVGFLKLFLSTEPVDLSHLIQRSPFEFDLARSDMAYGEEKSDKTMCQWETVLLTIIQRRSSPAAPNA